MAVRVGQHNDDDTDGEVIVDGVLGGSKTVLEKHLTKR